MIYGWYACAFERHFQWCPCIRKCAWVLSPSILGSDLIDSKLQGSALLCDFRQLLDGAVHLDLFNSDGQHAVVLVCRGGLCTLLLQLYFLFDKM